MKSVAKRKEEAIGKPTPKRSPSLDEMLDEALNETFPASDPVALTAPRRPSGSGQEPRNARRERELEACPPGRSAAQSTKVGRKAVVSRS
jgi:hypothetical protein